jgi:hypothetical protein
MQQLHSRISVTTPGVSAAFDSDNAPFEFQLLGNGYCLCPFRTCTRTGTAAKLEYPLLM